MGTPASDLPKLNQFFFQIDDIQLQDMLARIAPISTFVCPPGAGFAAIKFKEGVLEKALPRLTQECAALGK